MATVRLNWADPLELNSTFSEEERMVMVRPMGSLSHWPPPLSLTSADQHPWTDAHALTMGGCY